MQLLTNFSIFLLTTVMLGRMQELFLVLAPLQLGKVGIGLGVLMALLVNPQGLKHFITRTPMGKYTLIILIMAVISVPFSVWKGGAYSGLLSYSRVLLTVALLYSMAEYGGVQAFRFSIICSVIFLAVFTLVSQGIGRASASSTYDPNDIALVMVVFLPIIVAEALSGAKMLRVFYWGAALASVTCIALTQSRGGIVALCAIGLHALLLARGKRWMLVPLLGLGVLVILLAADETLWTRFQSVVDDTDYNFMAPTGRINMWKEGIALMLRFPLTGVGIMQFGAGVGMEGGGMFKAAHNSFIQLGAELGFIGLWAFLALIVSMIRSCRTAIKSRILPAVERNRRLALMISVTGYCAGGFFLSQAYSMIFYSVVVLAALMHTQFLEAQKTHRVAQPEKPLSAAAGDKQSAPLQKTEAPINGAISEKNDGESSQKKPEQVSPVKRLNRLELLAKGDALALEKKKRGGAE